jgi:hypothetical protein
MPRQCSRSASIVSDILSEDEIYRNLDHDERDTEAPAVGSVDTLGQDTSVKNISLRNFDDVSMIWWDLEGLKQHSLDIRGNGNLFQKSASLKRPLFVLLPDDYIKTIWDVLIAIVLSVSVFILPFRIAFLEWRMPSSAQDCQGMHDEDKCEILGCNWTASANSCQLPQLWYTLLIVDTATDFLFLADVMMSFRSAYFVEIKSERVLITDVKKISMHYVRTWFFIDLSASIPLEFINFLMQSRQSSLIGRALSSAKFIRLVNLAKMLRLLKIWRIKELWAGFISNATMDIFGFLFIFIVIAHTMACFMFWTGTFKDFVCKEESPLCTLDDIMEEKRVTWITRSYILTRDSGEVSVDELRMDYQYLISLYWAFTTMTTVGYGDLKPKTIYEVWALILCMLIGATTFSLLVGTVSHTIEIIQGSNFWERTYSMLSFMHGHRLQPDIRRRIRDFLGHERSAATHEIKGTLLEDLSPMVQKGILMNIHNGMLSSVPLFRNLLHEDSIDYLGSLSLRLCTELCNPGDILFCSGDVSRELILIDSGAFILIDAETSSHFATFRSGNFFGENCLLDGQETHVFSAVAESWCLIYRLRRRDFEDVLQDHTDHLQSIRLMAQLRWTRLKQAVEAHRILRCARNHKPGLTSQSLLRVLATLCADVEVGGCELSTEEKGLLKQIRSSSVPRNFWRTISLKICQAPQSDGIVDWDWSADWVDDTDLSKIADWFEESCESAALALKVASYLAEEPKPAVDFGSMSIAGLGEESGLSYASPTHDLEIVLSQALRRLEVVEAQARFIPKLETQVEMLQANLLAEEESDTCARF